MLARPKTVAFYSLCDLDRSLLLCARGAERPAVRAKGDRVKLRDAVLLADPQSPLRHSRRPPTARGERCERARPNTAFGRGSTGARASRRFLPLPSAHRGTDPGNRVSRISAPGRTGMKRRGGHPANPGTACSDRTSRSPAECAQAPARASPERTACGRASCAPRRDGPHRQAVRPHATPPRQNAAPSPSRVGSDGRPSDRGAP